MKKFRYTCPCCGYKTFSEFPGSDDICHICFWHDDNVQLLDPWFEGGPNEPSLVEAQINFKQIGACEPCAKEHAKGVLPNEELDPEWRPVNEHDRSKVRAPNELTSEEYRDLKVWHYWKA